MDWDDAYANGAYIENASDYPPRWQAEAAAFRESLGDRAHLDLAYGDAERERLDLFLPDGVAAGLLVFVHGGYWRMFDKSSWSHLAAGALAKGWAVAMPSYTLCPEAHIGTITQQIGAAITFAAGRVPGPVRLTGHSAGGHLVTRMLCTDASLPGDVSNRIENTVSISGVHDLRPLINTSMNGDFGLDTSTAAAESPALLTPRDNVRLTCWVGANERPEFVRQNGLLANIWTGLGATTRVVEDPERHHFDVIDGLTDPYSALMQILLE